MARVGVGREGGVEVPLAHPGAPLDQEVDERLAGHPAGDGVEGERSIHAAEPGEGEGFAAEVPRALGAHLAGVQGRQEVFLEAPPTVPRVGQGLQVVRAGGGGEAALEGPEDQRQAPGAEERALPPGVAEDPQAHRVVHRRRRPDVASDEQVGRPGVPGEVPGAGQGVGGSEAGPQGFGDG